MIEGEVTPALSRALFITGEEIMEPREDLGQQTLPSLLPTSVLGFSNIIPPTPPPHTKKNVQMHYFASVGVGIGNRQLFSPQLW